MMRWSPVTANNKPIEAGQEHQQKDGTAPALPRRAPFRFGMIGLKVGDELTFTPTGLVVRVAGDRTMNMKAVSTRCRLLVPTFLPEEQLEHFRRLSGAKVLHVSGTNVD